MPRTKELIKKPHWEEASKNIRMAMIQQGISSDKELAELIGVSRSTISRTLSRNIYTSDTLARIAIALKIGIDEIVKGVV